MSEVSNFLKNVCGFKRNKQNSISTLKDNDEEYLKVFVQDQKDPIFLPFHANRNVLFKDLQAKFPGASLVVLKKKGESYQCNIKNGVIQQPDVGWEGGRVWVVVDSEAIQISKDTTGIRWQKILTNLAPISRLPLHLNKILKRFNVSTWEELYASPRFSAPFQCNMTKFLQYRIGVIQLFTAIILRAGPEGFDLFTMFRISEGDYLVCEVLKDQLKDSRNCNCCKKNFTDSLEALRHYFDLEHAFKSRKMFDEPVYVSALLETARECGVFAPLVVFESASSGPLTLSTSNDFESKKFQPATEPPIVLSKALKQVKVEIVNLISPPESPLSASNSMVKPDLLSFSTPSPGKPVETETPQKASPMPPQSAVVQSQMGLPNQKALFQPQVNSLSPNSSPFLPQSQPFIERPRLPTHKRKRNGHNTVMQSPSALPVIQNNVANLSAHTSYHSAVSGNHAYIPNVMDHSDIPNGSKPPLSRTPGFFFASSPSLLNKVLIPSNQLNGGSNALVTTTPKHLIAPPGRVQENGASSTPFTQFVDTPKRSNFYNKPTESPFCLTATETIYNQSSQPASFKKVAKQRNVAVKPISTKRFKHAKQNANLVPLPPSVPVPVVNKPPLQAQHIVFSSDDNDDDDFQPSPQLKKTSQWKQVESTSSDSSSDSEDPTVPYRKHLQEKAHSALQKSVVVTPKSPTSPPPKKVQTAFSPEVPASQMNKSKLKPKSKDSHPVVTMASDSEVHADTTSPKKQPSMRPEMIPYEDFTPEYKCDLTTPSVSMDTLLKHFKVTTEAALYKLKAFKSPVKLLNIDEFTDYRRFILRNIRSFCVRQTPNFPFLFYMYKGLKTQDIYLADADGSYAMNCEKCDNMPLTMAHLFSKGHIMMFSKTRLTELQIGINYMRDMLQSTTGCNSEDLDIDPSNKTYIHLLSIYKVSSLDELYTKPNFQSSLLPANQVNQFRTKIIQAIVNTNSLKLPFITLLSFSIDKLIYLRTQLNSNLPLRIRCGQEGTLKCHCGQTFKGCLYVVHVLKDCYPDQSALETLRNIMDDMYLSEKQSLHGKPAVIRGYTTIDNLENCPLNELLRIVRSLRRYRNRNDVNAADYCLNNKIAVIEAELLRRGCFST